MSEPDLAGSNGELHAAAQRAVLGWALASQVIDNQVRIAVGERPSVLFWSYYSNYSTIILLLFWLFYQLYALYAEDRWRCRWVFIVENRHEACQRFWTSRRPSLLWNSSSIIFLHDHPPLSNGWARSLLPGLCSICSLDVLQPTIAHGLTLIINLLRQWRIACSATRDLQGPIPYGPGKSE